MKFNFTTALIVLGIIVLTLKFRKVFIGDPAKPGDKGLLGDLPIIGALVA